MAGRMWTVGLFIEIHSIDYKTNDFTFSISAIPAQGNTAEIVLTALHQNFIGVDEFLGMVVLPLSSFDVYERPRIRFSPFNLLLFHLFNWFSVDGIHWRVNLAKKVKAKIGGKLKWELLLQSSQAVCLTCHNQRKINIKDLLAIWVRLPILLVWMYLF